MKSSLNTGDQIVKFSASLVYDVRGEPAGWVLINSIQILCIPKGWDLDLAAIPILYNRKGLFLLGTKNAGCFYRISNERE